MKTALLIVDMQKVFLDKRKDNADVVGASEYINYTAGKLRTGGHVIVHVKDVEGENDNNRDEYGFISSIDVKPGDIEVRKLKSNAFWETGLEEILRANDVGLVIVSGFAAENCVLFTYNGASERNFRSVILHNGIVGENPSAVSDIYRDRNIISYPAIEFIAETGKSG
ncbi:MAG: isochorismatase family protein [Ignavibacteria bacterium]|nr:isochorismatase family protein [Ignavibacteria bacterium]